MSDTATPLVSVITLTYNHRQWIPEAIEGVLAQKTDFPFELLVAEDCSTDGTREIVFEYAERHPDIVRVITSDQNVGGRLNGKRVHDHPRGQFVAYCEGDDRWDDDLLLSKMVGFLLENPDYGMVHCHANRFRQRDGSLKRNALRMPTDLRDEDAYLEILSRRREIVSSSVCVRKTILDRVFAENPECFSERFIMGDTQRWLEISRLCSVKCLHEPMVTYRELLESYTKSKDKNKNLAFALNIRELQYHYLQKYPCPAEVVQKIRRRMSLSVLFRAFEACNAEHARDAMTDLRALGGRIPLAARLMRFGSGSPLRQRLVRPILGLTDFAARAFAKLGRAIRRRD